MQFVAPLPQGMIGEHAYLGMLPHIYSTCRPDRHWANTERRISTRRVRQRLRAMVNAAVLLLLLLQAYMKDLAGLMEDCFRDTD